MTMPAVTALDGRPDVTRLIEKAALTANFILFGPHSDAGRHSRRREVVEANARLNAFAQVAADVLHICPAPTAFEISVMDAVRTMGALNIDFSAQREVAADRRAAWHGGVRHEVLNYLSRY